MASQLSNHLWQTIDALDRAYRQPMRFATEIDPQDSEATAAAWNTVAHRRAILDNTLAAAAPFLGPKPEPAKRLPRPSRPRRPSSETPPARPSRALSTPTRHSLPEDPISTVNSHLQTSSQTPGIETPPIVESTRRGVAPVLSKAGGPATPGPESTAAPASETPRNAPSHIPAPTASSGRAGRNYPAAPLPSRTTLLAADSIPAHPLLPAPS